jgi:hypothetical protein
VTFIMNAQTGETLNFFYDEEKDLFTIRQWHEDEEHPEGGVEHYVTVSPRMIASIVEEAGMAEVEYLEDDDGVETREGSEAL